VALTKPISLYSIPDNTQSDAQFGVGTKNLIKLDSDAQFDGLPEGDNRPIALIDEHEFTRSCISTSLGVMCRTLALEVFPTLTAFIGAGQSKYRMAIYHLHASEVTGGTPNENIAELIKAAATMPVLVISDIDDFDLMMTTLGAGVRGFIPTSSTSLRVMLEVIRLVSVGGVFAPMTPSLMNQATKKAAPPADVATDRFTPRQRAVLERLKRGSANKIIAYELAMSEGTVKVHVRNIMKKLQASNRTQAVFRAYNMPSGPSAADADCAPALAAEMAAGLAGGRAQTYVP
jgi:DNA-binding NarL/FixJ family response regulator